LPQPLRKIPRPPVREVVIRQAGQPKPVGVLEPDELARRKEEAEWQLHRQRLGLDVREDHRRFALDLGDALTVPKYTGDIWWFVRDVNGPARTITAAALIFDQPRERTFPFDLVEVLELWDSHQINEAHIAYSRLNRLLGRASRRNQARVQRAA
jgi:hypothetical protein